MSTLYSRRILPNPNPNRRPPFLFFPAKSQAHADTEIKNVYGNTPLIVASACDQEAALRRLLEAGADTEATNNDGMTGLLMAVAFEKPLAVRALLQFHCQIDAQDTSGDTALNLAVDGPLRDLLLEILLDAGADTEVANHAGETPLCRASREARPKCVRLLLMAGADAESRNAWGFTPVQIASQLSNQARAGSTRDEALPDRTATLETLCRIPAGQGASRELLGWQPVHGSSRRAVAHKSTGVHVFPDTARHHQSDAMQTEINKGGDTTDEEYEQFSPRGASVFGSASQGVFSLQVTDSVRSSPHPNSKPNPNSNPHPAGHRQRALVARWSRVGNGGPRRVRRRRGR